MSARAFDPESLLDPLPGDAPCGADLVYDPAFVELEQAGAGKPERQYGDRIYPAEPADWPLVHEHALALAARTRDLRVGVWLARSSARLHGLAGFAEGLELVHGLLDRHWDLVHPLLDPSEGDDPTMRLNALTALAAGNAALADLRAATLLPVRGSLTVREVELGLGRAEPVPGETVPTEAGMLQALQGLLARQPELAAQSAQAHRLATAIDALLAQRVGAAQAPELGPLVGLLAALHGAVARAGGTSAAQTPAGETLAAVATAPAGASGSLVAIRSRGDAAHALERVCEWIEQNEPSNPAPLLIRRAQRLMDKNFVEIIRDLAPDGLNQVELIAGTNAAH